MLNESEKELWGLTKHGSQRDGNLAFVEDPHPLFMSTPSIHVDIRQIVIGNILQLNNKFSSNRTCFAIPPLFFPHQKREGNTVNDLKSHSPQLSQINLKILEADSRRNNFWRNQVNLKKTYYSSTNLEQNIGKVPKRNTLAKNI